jgi:Zn finger protein HypA/HybF involved in hydrogenase expression
VLNIFKKESEKEVKCPKCRKKVKPLLELNRVKSEFVGARYTGSNEEYLQICPHCKQVIGAEKKEIKCLEYDDKDITCGFCKFKGKPIIERNKMDVGLGMSPGPFFGRVGTASSMKPKRFILICPKCKALIGAK